MEFDLGRLKAERVAAGLTQKEMANKIGVNVTTYMRYENGESKMGIDLFSKYLNVLGYDQSKVSIFFLKNVTNRKRYQDNLARR